MCFRGLTRQVSVWGNGQSGINTSPRPVPALSVPPYQDNRNCLKEGRRPFYLQWNGTNYFFSAHLKFAHEWRLLNETPNKDSLEQVGNMPLGEKLPAVFCLFAWFSFFATTKVPPTFSCHSSSLANLFSISRVLCSPLYSGFEERPPLSLFPVTVVNSWNSSKGADWLRKFQSWLKTLARKVKETANANTRLQCANPSY